MNGSTKMANQNNPQPPPIPAPAPAQPAAVVVPVHLLNEQFERLTTELRAQGLTRDTKTYNGEGTKKLKEWLREMEKYERIINGDASRMRMFAIMTLTGVAGDYLRRMLQQYPQANWNQIKDAIVQRFSDLADQNYALKKLRQTKQGTGESVQAYGERILALSEDAYPGQAMNQPAIQREMIDVFIEGLKDDSTVRKLLRNRPADVYAAIEAAMEEQQVSRVFRAQRRHEEPMEVDMVRSNQDFYKDLNSKLEILASSVAQLTELQRQNNTYQTQNPQGFTPKYRGPGRHNNRRFEYTKDGKPICNYCKKVNHIFRDCRLRQEDQRRGNRRPQNHPNQTQSTTRGN